MTCFTVSRETPTLRAVKHIPILGRMARVKGIDEADRVFLVRAYRDGLSLAQCGRLLSPPISPQAVRYHLRRLGVELRQPPPELTRRRLAP